MNLFRTIRAARASVVEPTESGPAAPTATQARTVTSRPAGRVGRTLLFAVASAIVMVTSVQASGAAHAQYQPCTNYRVTTNWGRVEVDTRPSGADSIGNIAWAMFINDISHVPGRYDYQILINGKSLLTDTIHKDDNLHMTIPRYQQGRYVYESGDEIQVIASHAAGKTLYVTPINRCSIPYSAG
ncbi:hypothetical protein ACWDT6_19905 [Nocardia grenadensis]